MPVAIDLTQPESDFDGAWKEALRLYFRLFLKVYFPDIEVLVDWSHPPEWLDKEIRGVVGRVKAKSRTVDLVARVKLLSGESIRILIHVEVQTSHEEGFAFRVARYTAGLQHSRQERVVSLVILGDLDPNWMPDEDVFQCGSFRSHFWFPTCKLVRRLETDWKDDWSLPVIIARAQIEALRTNGKPEERAAVKWRMFRRLYDLGLDRDEILDVFRLIDWMVRLRPDLESAHNEQVEEFEKEHEMTYVTSYELFVLERVEARIKAEGAAEGRTLGRAEGKAEGIAEGKAEGSREAVLKLFGRHFRRISAPVRKQVLSLSNPDFDALLDAFYDMHSIDDLKRWLINREVFTTH